MWMCDDSRLGEAYAVVHMQAAAGSGVTLALRPIAEGRVQQKPWKRESFGDPMLRA